MTRPEQTIADRFAFRVSPDAEPTGDVLDTLADLLIDLTEKRTEKSDDENKRPLESTARQPIDGPGPMGVAVPGS